MYTWAMQMQAQNVQHLLISGGSIGGRERESSRTCKYYLTSVNEIH